MIFDVRENLLWKSVKEQIICYKLIFIYSNKVFYRWNYAFPIGEMPVERATYKAEYISPPKANVEYEVDGVITASESVVYGRRTDDLHCVRRVQGDFDARSV